MMHPREGQTLQGPGRLVAYANFVKLPHTIFALPFALVGVVLASYGAPVTVRSALWVVVAFTAARFAAMGFNRIVDREIDARNPRTASREIPRGVLTVMEAWFAVIGASVLFIFAASQLNGLCFALSPLALACVLFYSYTKRFTRWSHLVLGIGLGIAPAGGYLAITGAWSDPWWTLPALSAAVTTWVAGFDVLYALQDTEFDRREGLHSIPAALGDTEALHVSRGLHILSVAALGAAGIAVSATWLYAVGVAVVAALLTYEHSLVKPGDYTRLDAAFFRMNGIISVVFFVFVLAERLL